jgi:EmrB/QacA subfamily drug resistance transporter
VLHNIPMRQKILVMIAVMSGLFLVALDQTIISTALGKIVEEFNSFSSLSWVVTSYLLTSTVMVPIAGKLSDIFGRRQILMIGVALFTLASLLSGSAQNIEQLIAYRAFQGIGGGILIANAFTIIGDLFSPRERGRWQGLIGAVFGLASVAGPLLGGFLTDPHSFFGLMTNWRWTFWINVPIGIISFLIIARYTPQIKHEHKPKIDYWGAGLLTVALSSLILAVDNTEKTFSSIISADLTVGMIQFALSAIAVLAAAGFVWAEHRASEPIIPLSFFKNRTFTTVMIVALLFGAAFLGAILYLTQFNQQVFGADATASGLMLLPMILALSATAALVGQLVTKTGKYKIPLMIGFIMATVGVFALSTLSPTSPYWHEAIMMAFVGAGLGAGMPIMNLAVQNEFEQRDLGAATSSNQLARSLGSTIGTAVLGSMLTAGLVTHLGDLNKDPYIQALQQNPAAQQLTQNPNTDTALNLNTADIRDKISDGLDQGLASSPVPAPAKEAIKKDFEQKQGDFENKVVYAFSDSLKNIFYTSAGLMLLATIGAAFIRERPLRGGHDDTPGIE